MFHVPDAKWPCKAVVGVSLPCHYVKGGCLLFPTPRRI
jgi:hypothetical protein